MKMQKLTEDYQNRVTVKWQPPLEQTESDNTIAFQARYTTHINPFMNLFFFSSQLHHRSIKVDHFLLKLKRLQVERTTQNLQACLSLDRERLGNELVGPLTASVMLRI